MAKHSFWGGHLSPNQPVVEHEPSGSVVEMTIPHGAQWGEGKATYKVNYNDHGTHLVMHDVPGHGMKPLLQELDINDTQWLPCRQKHEE